MRRMLLKWFGISPLKERCAGRLFLFTLAFITYIFLFGTEKNTERNLTQNYIYVEKRSNFTRKGLLHVNFTWNSVLDILEHFPGKGDFLPSDSSGQALLYPDINKKSNLRNEKLTVFVLLHSHNDPGYLQTFDDYYYIRTKRVLSLAVKNLMKHKDLTFIWTDTCFLQRWWKEQNNETKENLKHLVKSGRFEIALGAWVSADECITHYFAYIDQLTEGYNWIRQHFNVFPNVSFNMDQFGSSASINYLRSLAGIKHSLVNHLHKGTKTYFRKHRLLEFYSRQLRGKTEIDDSFIHVEPFDNLAFRGSCGPSTTVCRSLDQRNLRLPNSKSLSFKLPKLLDGIPYWNVHQFAKEIVTQMKIKSDGYLHNVILLPLGHDTTYYTEEEWDNQYRNLNILMSYVNSYKDFNVRMKFGTLSEYFEEVKRQTTLYEIKYPLVSGDLYPYTRGPKYWSGYFATRQFAKRLGRELQESVRATDLLISFLIYSDLGINIMSADLESVLSKLLYARRELYIFQHHDAITGTSEEQVAKDYRNRLSSAFLASQEILSFFIRLVLNESCTFAKLVDKPNNNLNNSIFPIAFRDGSEDLTQERLINIKENTTNVIVFNSYAQTRRELITVSIQPKVNVQISDPYGHLIDFDVEVSPKWTKLTFLAVLPPASLSVFDVKQIGYVNGVYKRSKKQSKQKKLFVCRNNELNVTYSLYDGTPLELCLKNDNLCTQFKINFIHYPTGSDAWTFPDSIKNIKIKDYSMYRTVTRKSYCSVEFFYGFVSVKYTLHKGVGINERRLQMDIHDNLSMGTAANFVGDIAVRVQTGIENRDVFYTDSNSVQLMKRIHREQLAFGASVYPMTSMAVIQDKFQRLTVHSSQPHGVVSRESGSLDIMIDRVVISEGDGTVRHFQGNTKDNLPTFTKLNFQFERKVHSEYDNEMESLKPSLSSIIINDLIQHPLYSFHTQSIITCKKNKFTFLNRPLPSEVMIANLKCLVGDELDIQGLTLTLFRREVSQSSFKNMSLQFDPSSLFQYNFKTVSDMYKEGSIRDIHKTFFESLELKTFIMK